MPLTLALTLYAVLLVTPLPLPFMSQQVRNLVMASLPEGSQLELGEMALAVEGGTWPVIRFSPVTYTDTLTGGRVRMGALEVGFSPLRALIGQPGAVITLVSPHIQINQDLFGPRLASFEVERHEDGTPLVVRVLEGSAAFPSVGFSPGGIEVGGEMPEGTAVQMRSDNDWLIYNMEAMSKSVGDIMEQARAGTFSRLVIRGGTLDMNDAVYAMFRTFTDITLDIAPTSNGRAVEGNFAANFGGSVMSGTVERMADADGTTRLKAAVTNLNFAALVPFVDDPEAQISVNGGSALSMDIGFDGTSGKIVNGRFHVDLTGMDLRIDEDYFPIASSIVQVDWTPENAQFTMAPADLTVGRSTGQVGGVFALGLDELYGPTVAMSMTGSQISLHPNDLDAPTAPFSNFAFSGWSAPLYGAMGIDHFEISREDGARVATRGRVDMLRRGLGFDMTVAGEKVSADDLKRLWPYFLARESRDWFVKHVTAGTVESSTMKYSFPVGTLVEGQPMPDNAMSIEMVGTGVHIVPMEGMAPIAVEGQTRLQVRDTAVTIAADGGRLATTNGEISVANAAMVMDSDGGTGQLIEISGDLSGDIPAIIDLAKERQPELLANPDLPLDLAAIDGDITARMLATITLDAAGETKSLDYAVNGVVQDFGSKKPIENLTINNGQLSFSASQEGYRVAGKADVQGLTADVVIEGDIGEEMSAPDMLLSASLKASDLAKMGFDASEFLDGEVKFVARPMTDGSIQMAIDLKDAALTVRDLGINKRVGVAGTLKAAVKQKGDVTELSQIDLGFGDVALRGGLQFDAKKGLQSAQFTRFALSPGDSAQISLSPINDGYEVRIRGEQLDLKPMLSRFFSLEGGVGGPQATTFNQALVVDAQLTRAVGFYRTTAFNVDLDLSLRGSDLRRVSLQAQLGGDRSISVATNPTPSGKVLSVAFNDLGTLLRFMNVYPNLEGGEGTLVLDGNTAQKLDRGQFSIRNFAIVDESNVAQILGNHSESRQLIARQNKLSFRSAEAEFIRREKSIEVTEAMLSGASVGGTMRGVIHTDPGQYDLTGTYVPMFGLNNAFQKFPIFGPLLGGREGEGLFGVTFAVRGPLDKPNFLVNPLSALVPGAFRGLFEYRARTQQPGPDPQASQSGNPLLNN